MNPPECKTCGKRTDLSDQYGNARCWACRRELFPEVFGEPAGAASDQGGALTT